MSELQKCETCGRALERRWEASTPEMVDLASFIESLFDYRGEVTTRAVSPFKTLGAGPTVPVYDYALGASRRPDQEPPIRELVGLMRESFQRTFGEKNTGRKFWWREKPNIVMAIEFDIRCSRYALWFACAIEGLTEHELKQLNYIPEMASVTCNPL